MSDDPSCTNCGHLASGHAYGLSPCAVSSIRDGKCGCTKFSTYVDWETECMKARGALSELSDEELLKSCVIVCQAADLSGIWVAYFTDFNCITQGTSRTEAVVSLLDAARLMLKHSIPSSACDMAEVVGSSTSSAGTRAAPNVERK